MTAERATTGGIRLRPDLEQTQRELWQHVRAPGAWWSGGQRIAIAEESRRATGCPLCRERKAALSPAVGSHAASGALPAPAVEAVHRIRNDPARLSRSWFEGLIASGLGDGAYVELVGVVAMLAGADGFARALGVAPFPLPAPLPGEPSRRRPASASAGGAWVPMIDPEQASGPEADLYGPMAFVPHIVRALSLVPDEVRMLRRLCAAFYVPPEKLQDPTVHRALDRMQTELVAARVSALNECFY